MSPRPDIEKLLGGYATDTLTPAEREELFRAALSNQALFDALADEQVLKELLQDPASRARLVAALREERATALAEVMAWLRRPGVLALGGAVAAAVLLLVAVHPGNPRREAPAIVASRGPAPLRGVPVPQAAPQPATPAPPARSRMERKQEPLREARNAAPKAEPAAAPPAAPPPPAAAPEVAVAANAPGQATLRDSIRAPMAFSAASPAGERAAQAAGGSITGVITDPAGANIPNARVSVTKKDTNAPVQVESTPGGVYQAQNLSPGVYRVEITAPGFRGIVKDGVTVAAGGTERVNAQLVVGQAAESVAVTAEAVNARDLYDAALPQPQKAMKAFGRGGGAPAGLMGGIAAAPTSRVPGVRYTMVQRLTDGSTQEIDPGKPVAAGNPVRLRFEANQDGDLEVFRQAADGSWTQWGSAHLRAAQPAYLPAADFVSMPAPGDIRFFVRFARTLPAQAAANRLQAMPGLARQQVGNSIYVVNPARPPDGSLDFEFTLVAR